MHYTAQEIANITGARAELSTPSATLLTVGYDSRRISLPESMLFFALKGKLRDGADFVQTAYQSGVRNFVVNEDFVRSGFENCNFIFSQDPLLLLQTLAARHRAGFSGMVIAITGSNGKTIVKEWLYHLLKNDFTIHRSPRSFNSRLGVAISLLGIEKWHNMAIIEAGISEPGDMDILESMIKPNMGIFTHLGSAHQENFESAEAKAREKVKLFKDSDVLIYPADQMALNQEIDILKREKPLLKTISWGFEEKSGFAINKVTDKNARTEILFTCRSVEHKLVIPFEDKAGLENAMSCLCALAALERWDEEHISGFLNLPVLENRLDFLEARNGNYVVNDSYSNDLDSLEVALDFLLRQQPDKPHTVILSDLEQADPDKNRLYEKVGRMLTDKQTSQFIGIGPEIAAHKNAFHGLNASFYADADALLESQILEEIQHQGVLIKGARSFKLERISDFLRKKLQKSTLDIDLTALRNNYSWFRHQLPSKTKVMAMVKAFGYGSGSFEAARTLQFAGVDYLTVAFTDEGVALRKAGIHLPVMVMNTGISDLRTLLDYKLEPVVFSAETLEEIKEANENIRIHIEIDSGMHRLGFDPQNCGGNFKDLPGHVHIVSVFSHLAASEMPAHDEFTRQQLRVFLSACDEIEKETNKPFLRHIANTGGVMRFPEAHLDMVRLGIGLYGIHPSGEKNSLLENVLTLKTTISQIKKIPAGESVSYGRGGVHKGERTIAVLPLGYADGLWRLMGHGNGYALICGEKAPYVGSICMDMAMADVTGIDCKAGDEVEIFGKSLRIEDVAKWCKTIPYEILTSVSERVQRVYSGEN